VVAQVELAPSQA
jgi:hypothetical protein